MNMPLHFIDLPNAPISDADILVLPLPWERTVSFKSGTSAAPRAILESSTHLEFFEEDAGWSPFKYMTISVLPEFLMDSQATEAALQRQLKDYVSSLPQNTLLVSLGGEHSLTPGLVQARMPLPGTVIFLDAHADMRTTYEGSEFNHACPVNHLLGQNHQLIMGGIRSIFESEAKRIESDPRLTVYLDRQLQNAGHRSEFLRLISGLQGPVYLSIDMDVFDPAVVPGVGTPQPGGFSWYQTLELIETLMANQNIQLVGVDLVEMIPESSKVSEMTAAKLLLKIISFWGKAHGFDAKPEKGSQMAIEYE